jgi:hypothetical protein
MFAFLNHPVVEVPIIWIMLLLCFLQGINTLDSLPGEVHWWIGVINMVSVYIFVVKFFHRWWSTRRFQLRYLSKPLILINMVRVGVYIIPTPLIFLLLFFRFFPNSAAHNLSFGLLCCHPASPTCPPSPSPHLPPPPLLIYTTPLIMGLQLQIVVILLLILNVLLPLWDHRPHDPDNRWLQEHLAGDIPGEAGGLRNNSGRGGNHSGPGCKPGRGIPRLPEGEACGEEGGADAEARSPHFAATIRHGRGGGCITDPDMFNLKH